MITVVLLGSVILETDAFQSTCTDSGEIMRGFTEHSYSIPAGGTLHAMYHYKQSQNLSMRNLSWQVFVSPSQNSSIGTLHGAVLTVRVDQAPSVIGPSEEIVFPANVTLPSSLVGAFRIGMAMRGEASCDGGEYGSFPWIDAPSSTDLTIDGNAETRTLQAVEDQGLPIAGLAIVSVAFLFSKRRRA
ncbi:MAG TPA: hypothetical protein VGR28_10505 [Candidatus Thermoplasmatota archaeon]|nr:hypothetical protein [Candidatus Thermoplasmatota archaeon]